MFKSKKLFGFMVWPFYASLVSFIPLYINTMLQHYYKINISALFIRKTSQFFFLKTLIIVIALN